MINSSLILSQTHISVPPRLGPRFKSSYSSGLPFMNVVGLPSGSRVVAFPASLLASFVTRLWSACLTCLTNVRLMPTMARDSLLV